MGRSKPAAVLHGYESRLFYLGGIKKTPLEQIHKELARFTREVSALHTRTLNENVDGVLKLTHAINRPKTNSTKNPITLVTTVSGQANKKAAGTIALVSQLYHQIAEEYVRVLVERK